MISSGEVIASDAPRLEHSLPNTAERLWHFAKPSHFDDFFLLDNNRYS